ETARQLSKYNVHVFRAGIWKPRTRPNTFEGMGTVALPWLQRVKKETNLLTTTEVANSWHVKEALKYNVDIFWIGARTTANPFAVQEVADALRGLDIPVFVKNPINPDIELWIGAIERINKAGIKKIVAVHRGFSSYGNSQFRNHPQWEIPIELKRRIPDIPIVTDPSHICGTRKLLHNISQRAMDLNFDGLFIESHIDPEKALSDKNQQITPAELGKLLDKLVLRKSNITDLRLMDTLAELREQIDQYDEDILDLFMKRMRISETIGKYKKENNITIFQQKRWTEILEQRTYNGRNKGLNPDFVARVFKAIHQESINIQNNVMN
ncbi:MAG: bifunctional 3-deoxy-7-phosphoheptulonate synthase/chorismate mutase type II, partial [Bacteroidales bacterium]